jgi:hypothetical protein
VITKCLLAAITIFAAAFAAANYIPTGALLP